jgi:hypothetical protein
MPNNGSEKGEGPQHPLDLDPQVWQGLRRVRSIYEADQVIRMVEKMPRYSAWGLGLLAAFGVATGRNEAVTAAILGVPLVMKMWITIFDAQKSPEEIHEITSLLPRIAR